MKRIFVSSTFRDLEAHRKAVREIIRQLGAVDIAMENFGARDERPKEECLRIIREESDIFIGIYAHRYGYTVPGDERSITEEEYWEAVKVDLPVLVYFLDETYPWQEELKSQGRDAQKLAALKQLLGERYIRALFTTPDSLAAKVAADLGREFSGEQAELVLRGLIHQPSTEWVSPITRNPHAYKVVAFDLDGTLLRGVDFSFSWEAVWQGLGFAKKVQNDLRREYRERVAEEDTRENRVRAYQNWCERAVGYYKTRGLTRARLREITEAHWLTHNCREALSRLRQEGVVIAFISGGLDTFLEDLFPDYRDYADFVFVNQLTFSPDGKLDGVIASAYDFEGKAEALALVCQRVGCVAQEEAVFIGDHFNDEAIMLSVAKAIAYPPQDEIISGVSHAEVTEDDLNAILPYILGD
jgi:HAD superfamily phosphoserine phosphatase-like hydrolase